MARYIKIELKSADGSVGNVVFGPDAMSQARFMAEIVIRNGELPRLHWSGSDVETAEMKNITEMKVTITDE